MTTSSAPESKTPPPDVETYAYSKHIYEGTLTRYRNGARNRAFAARSHLAEHRIRGRLAEWRKLSFERFFDRLRELACELRNGYVHRFGWFSDGWPGVHWRWNADLPFVIDNTTIELTREQRPLPWGFGDSPRVSLRVWALPDRWASGALLRRAHEHFVAGRPALFYRDMVGAHALDRGNAGTATVLANALSHEIGGRRVFARERLDLIAMAGTTEDFLKMWNTPRISPEIAYIK